MPLHHLRSRVREGAVTGTTVMIASPAVVEALGGSPFETICIDAEHTPLTVEGLEGMLRAADIAPKPVVVRVPEVGSYIARVLDMGAAGIIVPRVETAAQAAEAVARARYAPEGVRGAGPGRAQAYGATLTEYVEGANASILVAIQIETRAGLDAVDEILATPGIDVVIIGPFDLAVSMGVAMGSAEHDAAIERIFAVADGHGVVKGAFAFGDGAGERFARAGATLIFVGGDLPSVISGAQEAWDAMAAVMPTAGGSAR